MGEFLKKHEMTEEDIMRNDGGINGGEFYMPRAVTDLLTQMVIPKLGETIADLQSSETADLFMSVIMYRLKHNGRVAVIIPMVFCLERTTQRLPSRKSYWKNSTFTPLCVCHTMFLRVHKYNHQYFAF